MCDEWLKSFDAFYDWAMSNGYKQGLQIDRIDNNGNYEPLNCRFVSRYANAKNKSNTVMFTYNNRTMCVKDWARYLGINYKSVMTRLHRGWSFEEALCIVKRDNRFSK